VGVAKTLARVRADGVIERAVRERGEVEQEAIRIGLEAAFGNDAAIVDVKVWYGVAEFSYKRRPLNRDRRVVEEALEAALPGGVARVARAGADVVAAAVRGVGWQPEEPPVFEVEGPGDAQAELSSDPWRVQRVQFVPFLLAPKPFAVIPRGGLSGRGGRLRPLPEAEGPHTSFKTDEAGRVTKYEEYAPQSNPRNPNPWESVKRYDGNGNRGGHFNPVTNQRVREPHIHGSTTPGGIRPASPDEIPGGSQ
jgi:hypothetical protein